MQHNGNSNTGARMATHSLRWGAHKRIQHNINFDPRIHEWVGREQVASGLSFSEVVNRELKKQHDLREQLASLTSEDPNQQAPVFHVLLEQQGQKMSKTMDGVIQEVQIAQAMIAAFAEIAMNPQQFKQWETRVFGKGKNHDHAGRARTY